MNCVKSLHKTCARYSLLPRSLQIGLCYDPASASQYRGGFADVWKGEHCGMEVAVKVLRVYADSDLQKIARVGFPSHVIATMLTVTCVEVLQGVPSVESSSSSERITAARSHHDRDPVCDGVRVDGKREHQPIRCEISRCK